MTPYHRDDWLTVWQGDCVEVMAQMEPESVHCVVTSPPYWGLRDYGTATWLGGDEGCDHLGPPRNQSDKSTLGIYADGTSRYKDGWKSELQAKQVAMGTPYKNVCGKCGAVRQDSQLGLEPTPEEYVANMVAVFREVRRVLRADGTCWVNLGDSYAQTEIRHRNGPIGEERPRERGRQWLTKRSTVVADLKPKDLVGIPWRVAFALQADGWYLRSDIIWSKPNPMPESVTDRPTKAHEYLFLLSKSPRYYYDADAVREEAKPESAERYAAGYRQFGVGQFNGSPTDKRGPKEITGDQLAHLSGRNLRSVWTIATQPYPGAHFATFPEKLVEPCVKAGTSERGVCSECGAPWRRVVERVPFESGRERERNAGGRVDGFSRPPGGAVEWAHRIEPTTTGWQPSCSHADTGQEQPLVRLDGQVVHSPVPAVVLDPFAGSGTTGRVAQRLGRRAVLIDLNADYLVQAMKRNTEIPLGLETA